ncbi:carboxypeptidase regulatory-like domain-containing protein [Lacrimispora algidixylanolytica]|uniref:Carboxypeptidase regulatory-like domain-containing protein n=1 Tax=Lacrimispora algidixylanolytica TaxID=94868 RepID=A0A419TCM4_9FIRM|nr:carboxypeptidase regulatory-like domain-containing protein [Lacrimispora algidixylanolytica]RKD35218.1 hypothetical protein BET01_02420 [Lacrimispora algidixylanolytica]
MSNLCFTGCQVICSGIITADVTLHCNSFLFLTGIVYSPKGEPLPNVAVEIRILDTADPNKTIRLGITFTLLDGSYGITLPNIPGRQYKLLAFSAI